MQKHSLPVIYAPRPTRALNRLSGGTMPPVRSAFAGVPGVKHLLAIRSVRLHIRARKTRTVDAGRRCLFGGAEPEPYSINLESPPLSLSANNPLPTPSPIAGTLLPIQRAEELLGTLPGVISARIVSGPSGEVNEIHLLTTNELTPKQTVRNVESALLAHLGMRVSHKKISVATSTDPQARPVEAPRHTGEVVSVAMGPQPPRRRIYFEDVEVRRSRTKGVTCRVTLRKGEGTYVGEAEGIESDRHRIELAARATLTALQQAEMDGKYQLALEGCKHIDAFEREFVFVGISARAGRDTMLLTGSAEVRESPETAGVLAVLDATNRWVEMIR